MRFEPAKAFVKKASIPCSSFGSSISVFLGLEFPWISASSSLT
jgi:hypothetical protein